MPDMGPLPDVGVDGGTDGGPDAGPVCTNGMSRCSAMSDAVETCTAGAWVAGPVCTLGCRAMATPHCGTFSPQNVARSLTGSGTDLTIAAPTDVSTDTCSGLGTATGRMVTQDASGGPAVCLFEVNALTISSTVRVAGSRPLVIVAHGAVTISGVLDASSYSNPMSGTSVHAGPGSGTGGNTGADGGAGSNNTDGGGGGGGFGGNGGSGAAEGMGSSGGGGGAAVPSMLSPLIGGANGGNGSGVTSDVGGPGGGGIQITSFVSIRIDGTVAAAGAAGLGGGEFFGGGGGGSGGGILLEAPTIMLGAGDASFGVPVTVAGGGGGGGGCGTGMAGNPGTDGAYALAMRAAGAVSMCGTHDGGAGGGGTTLNGGASMNNGGANGAGGGGGVGRIVFRTVAGTVPMGTTNPSTGMVIATMPLTIN